MSEPPTTIDGQKDFFGHDGQAEMYKHFRPEYPNEVIEYILAKVPPTTRKVYVDVACGSGQMTYLLAPHFEKSIGLDKSEEQISQTTSLGSNLEFLAGSAFCLPVADSSVDLVTVAEALHWLVPHKDFFKEVERVLKPGGVFVTVAYSFSQPVHAGAKKLANYYDQYVLGRRLEPGQPGCWWDTNTHSIDCQYMDVAFPENCVGLERVSFPTTVKMSVQQYFGYMRTLSAYRTLMCSGVTDPLIQLQADMMHALGCKSASDEMEVTHPFFALSFSI